MDADSPNAQLCRAAFASARGAITTDLLRLSDGPRLEAVIVAGPFAQRKSRPELRRYQEIGPRISWSGVCREIQPPAFRSADA